MEERVEYGRWLKEQKENPAWGKEKTPVEKVQGVTEPVADSIIETLVEQGLKGSSNPWTRSVGLAMKGLGPIADVLLSPKDAW